MWSHGNFYWNELMTHDVERAKKFYDATVGWSFEAMPMPNGTHWVAKMGDKSVGGLFPMTGPDFEDMPEQWMSYVAVDDVDARMKRQPLRAQQCARSPLTCRGSAASSSSRSPAAPWSAGSRRSAREHYGGVGRARRPTALTHKPSSRVPPRQLAS